MKIVTKIRATMISLDCPCCGCQQEGFLNDPRGGKFTCDDCGKEYCVDEDATVRLD